ncbi:MAG: hypothetical protein ACTSQX_04735, partial [Candidatus Heimdallarchaeota archaeon]
AFRFGNGWLCFVKNTPIKPLTIDPAVESKTAISWINYIVSDYFSNKIIPSYTFYWRMPSDDLYSPDSQAHTFSSLGSEIGKTALNFPYDITSLDISLVGGIPKMILPRFSSTTSFVPELATVREDALYDLQDGYIRDWIINTYEDKGLSYLYPDTFSLGTIEGSMFPGSTLFRTTFDTNHWSYDFDWEAFDIGRTDYFDDSSGMIWDKYFTNETALRIDKGNLLEDSELFYDYTIGNGEFAPHFLFSDNYTTSYYYDAFSGITNVGYPYPSAYFYNPENTSKMMYIGAVFNPLDVYDLISVNNSLEFIFEFDYWFSQTNSSSPISLTFDIVQPVGDRLDNPVNPANESDLISSLQFSSLVLPTDQFEYNLWNDENDTVFTRFQTSDITDNINDRLVQSVTDYYTNNNLFDQRWFFVISMEFSEDKGNQTGFFDNLRLSVDNSYYTSGVGNGYGLNLDGSFYENIYYDINEQTKLIHYPFIYLEDVYSTDFSFTNDRDYEFVVRLDDITNDYQIYLHYFWSDDDTIHSDQNYDEQLIVDGSRIDFFIKRNDSLPLNHDLLQFDLLTGLNKLIQKSGFVIDREHVIHTLDLSFLLDNEARNLQIGCLSIQGIAPWIAVNSTQDYIYSTYDLGTVTGISEVTILANSYLWSEEEQTIRIQLWSPVDNYFGESVCLIVNGQQILSVVKGNDANYTESNPPSTELRLKAGINTIRVKALNSKHGSRFFVHLLDMNNESLTCVKAIDSNYQFFNYPMVSGSFGNGLIAFLGFNYDNISSSIDNEPLVDFFKNILINELSHRNLEYMAAKQSFMAAIVYNLQHKHQDMPFDWDNEDDPFSNTEDTMEIFGYIENIIVDLNQEFNELLTAARINPNIVLNYTQLSGEVYSLLNKAKITGGVNNQDIYWSLRSSSQSKPQNNIGIINDGDEFSTQDDYSNPLDIYDPIFAGLNRQKSIALCEYSSGLPEDKYHYLCYMQREEKSNCIEIKIKETIWYADWSIFGYSVSTNPLPYNIFGSYRIFSAEEVWVDNNIKSDTGKVFLEASTTSYYNYFDVINATAYAIQEITPYKEHTSQENTLTMLSNILPNSHIDILFADIGLGRSVNSFIESIQMQMFDMAYAGAFAYFMANAEDDMEGIIDEDESEYEIVGEAEPEEKTPYKYDPILNLFDRNGYTPGIGHVMFHYKNKSPQPDVYEYGIDFKKGHYAIPIYQLLQPLGEKKGKETMFLVNQILCSIMAFERVKNNLPAGLRFIKNIWSTKTNLNFYLSDVGTKLDNSNWGALCWLGPNSEGLLTDDQSLLNLGISKDSNFILTFEKETGYSLHIQTETHIDRQVFEDGLYELFENENSPYYRDTIKGELKYPIKLKELSSNVENGKTVTYYQLIFYERDGQESQTDIIIRKSDVGLDSKYELAYFRDNLNPNYYSITPTGEKTTYYYEECVTIHSTEINPQLITDNSELDLFKIRCKSTKTAYQIKRLPGVYKEDGKPDKYCYVFYRSGSTMYNALNGYTQICENTLLQGKTGDTQNKIINSGYSVSNGISHVVESTDPNNNYLTITHTHSGESSFRLFYNALKKETAANILVSNYLSHVIFPLLLIQPTIEILTGTRKTTFDSEVQLPLSVVDAYHLAGAELIRGIEGINSEKISRTEKGIRFSDCLTPSTIRKNLFSTMTKKGIIDKSNIHLLMPFDKSPPNIRERLSDITKLVHGVRAFEHENVYEYISNPLINNGKKMLPIGAIEYQLWSRINKIFPTIINGQTEVISYINSYEAWLLRRSNNHIGFSLQGRKNAYDYSDGKFAPIMEQMKIFMWMLNYLPNFKKGETDLYIIDDKGNLIPNIDDGVSHGDMRFMTKWDLGEDGIQNAGRLVTPAQISALRILLERIIDLIGITYLIDNEQNSDFNEFINLLNINHWANVIISRDKHLDLTSFGTTSTLNPDNPTLSNPKRQSDAISLFTDYMDQWNTDMSFVSKDNLGRELFAATGKKPNLTTFIKNFGLNLFALPVFTDENMNEKDDISLIDIFLEGIIRVRDNDDGSISYLKEYMYFDESLGKWNLCVKKISSNDVIIIDENFNKATAYQGGSMFKAANKDEAKNLPQGKVWIIQLTDKNGNPKDFFFGQFHDANIRDIITMAPNQNEIFRESVTEIALTEKQWQKFCDDMQIDSDITAMICPSSELDQIHNQRNTLNLRAVSKLRNNDFTLPGGKLVGRSLFFPDSILDSFTSLPCGFASVSDYELYRMVHEKENELLSEMANHIPMFSTMLQSLEDDPDADLKYNYFINSNKFKKYSQFLTRQNIDGLKPYAQFNNNQKSKAKYNSWNLIMKLLGGYAVLGSAKLSAQLIMSLSKNIRTQLWQTKIIEFFSHASYQDTYINNILTMRDLNHNEKYDDEDDYRGKFIERYAIDSPTGDGNATAYREGILLAAIVWLSDYLEFGPADIFEYINGAFSGSQLAKVELGMIPVCVDVPYTIANAIIGWAQINNLPIPLWMQNATKILLTPAFKTMWFAYLFSLGSTISVLKQLIMGPSLTIVVQGFMGTATSMLSSFIVQNVWEGATQVAADTLWMINDGAHWSEYAIGDKNMALKIGLYDIATALHNLGSIFRFDHWFLEIFYLGSYFPNLGVWSFGFDSLLPFGLISVLILCNAFGALGILLVGSKIFTAAFATFLAGCALFWEVTFVLLVVAYIIFALLKILGIFKRRDPSTIGDY